jgi:hypothetical protein
MAGSSNGVSLQQDQTDRDVILVRDGESGGGVHKNGEEAVPEASRPSKRRTVDRVRAGDQDRPAAVKSIVDTLNEKAKAKSVQAPYDPDTAEACPFFWELVTKDRYDAERDRLLPEITLTRVDGGWEAVIRDIETSQETRFAFGAFLELARAAEKHLVSARGLWKPFKNRKNQKGIERHVKKKT